MDDYDIFSPMFDDYLHPQDDTFEVSYVTHPEYATKCAFCNTEFASRSQLFKHLGYMGINIRPKLKMGPLKKNQYCETKGDCGYFVKEKPSYAQVVTPSAAVHNDGMDCDEACNNSHDINTLCHHFDSHMCVE